MKLKLTSLFILLISISSFSQKIKIQKGDIGILKGIDAYNLIFDYSNLKIANYESEAIFLKEKIALREKKKEGRGLKFEKDWFESRKKLYEPYFENYFNSYFSMKRKIFISKNYNKAKFTVLVKTKFIYPGYNVGVAFEPAKLHVTLTIFETENPKNKILKTRIIKVYQGDTDYNLGYRIANAYGVLGWSFAKFLRKKT